MPLQIVQKSIAEMCCDAIVDPTDSSYSGSGGAEIAGSHRRYLKKVVRQTMASTVDGASQ